MGAKVSGLGSFLRLGAQDLFVFVSLCFLISGSQGHKDEHTRGNQVRLFRAPRISIVLIWAATCKSEIAVKHSAITKECGNRMMQTEIPKTRGLPVSQDCATKFFGMSRRYAHVAHLEPPGYPQIRRQVL